MDEFYLTLQYIYCQQQRKQRKKFVKTKRVLSRNVAKILRSAEVNPEVSLKLSVDLNP